MLDDYFGPNYSSLPVNLYLTLELVLVIIVTSDYSSYYSY